MTESAELYQIGKIWSPEKEKGKKLLSSEKVIKKVKSSRITADLWKSGSPAIMFLITKHLSNKPSKVSVQTKTEIYLA